MIKLIILEEEKPVFNPEIRMFAPFRTIIERDRGSKGDNDGRKKKTATKELAFIYWFADPRSNYKESYRDEAIRTERIKKHLDLPEDWKIDEDIRKAIYFYQEQLDDDFDVKLIDSCIHAVEVTRDDLNKLDMSKVNKAGVPIYKHKEILSAVKEAGGVLDSLRTMREKMFRLQSLNSKIRGGGEKAVFEIPTDDDYE